MHRRSSFPRLVLAFGGSCAAAAVACSLTLPSESAYFGAGSGSSADAADAAQDGVGADAPAGPESGPFEAGAEDATIDDARGPDSAAIADGLGGDAGADGVAPDARVDASVADAGGLGGSADASAASDGHGGSDAANFAARLASFDAAALDPATLVVWYPFEVIDDDDAGLRSTPDRSGNGLNAELFGVFGDAATGGTPPAIDPAGHVGNGLRLDSALSQYVQLPAGVLSTFAHGMSVSCWINLRSRAVWDRLFDFNNPGPTLDWIYFSPTGWNPTTMSTGTHFAVAADGSLDPEMVLTQTIAPGAWHHVAVVFDPPYLLYFLDGAVQYLADDMKPGIEPSALGSTVQNWLGRSSYPADPFLNASIDEFRLYSGGLTPAQVAQLAAQ